MNMTNIIDSLVQEIDEGSLLYIPSRGKYQRELERSEQHLQWLEEHLNEEEKAHLEEYRTAELNVSTLECAASIKLALAVGIRLALPQ